MNWDFAKGVAGTVSLPISSVFFLGCFFFWFQFFPFFFSVFFRFIRFVPLTKKNWGDTVRETPFCETPNEARKCLEFFTTNFAPFFASFAVANITLHGVFHSAGVCS